MSKHLPLTPAMRQGLDELGEMMWSDITRRFHGAGLRWHDGWGIRHDQHRLQ
jgi:hypothetical protein